MMTENFNLKQRVAREAANLLYFGAEKEYKQAKNKAAQILGTNFLPSNLEVAVELDKIAEEKEGPTRRNRLICMRKEALQVMKLLREYKPLLIGSVWRGTIKVGSDIDIAVYTDEPEEIIEVLRNNGINVLKSNWANVNKRGETLESFHIYAQTEAKHSLEIVARKMEDYGKKRKCETFGDEIRGLKIKELEKVLQDNATQQFTPQ
jgi:predicted nucleotidyltransferase